MASHTAKIQSIVVEKDTLLDIDPGHLTVTDTNPLDIESYSANLDEYVSSTARDGILAALYTLPSLPSPDGPLAQLPPPTTPLPRVKHPPPEDPVPRRES